MAARVGRECPDVYSSEDVEEDYGLIRPSLIKQLRSILDQYPDDGQILKELIQNAEDAGASEVKFLYDEIQYPTKSLHHPDLAHYQGRSLYAYNNARFEKKDWMGIRMLQDSVKEKDPMKVGRFGLGFKSVLHMTDLPSVMSGDRLLIIDPQEKFFQYKGDPSSGYSWNLKQKKALMETIPDQFEPYKSVFGNTPEIFDSGCYEGTLFRFPLREQQSRLSETVYGPERISHLFASFEADAQTLMIFLKNIESIKLYKRAPGQVNETLLYEVRLTDDCRENVRKMRTDFVAQCSDISSNKEATLAYQVAIETLKYDAGNIEKKTYTWLVNEHKGGADISAQLRTLQEDPTLALVPLVGVALPIKSRRDSSDKSIVQNRTDPTAKGQVFCFLPLPVEQRTSTGLPVHVNGYFAISQNRRHLKWPTAGHNIESDKSVHWNQCLIQELLPSCYLQLILHAIRISEQNATEITPEEVYQALPNHEAVDEKWQVFLESLFEKLFSHPVIFTTCASGMWVRAEKAVYDCLDEDECTMKIITEVCLRGDVNIARVPGHLLRVIRTSRQHSPQTVSPGSVRVILRQNPATYSQLSSSEKLRLLLYILGDHNFKDLQGIQLLPCADGSFTTFQRHGEKMYIPSNSTPRELFPGLENLMLPDHLDHALHQQLAQLATEGVCQLQHIDRTAAIALICKVVPKVWTNRCNNDQITVVKCSSIYTLWLNNLWDFLRREFPTDISVFSGLPILPFNTGQTLTVVPLTMSSKCIMKSAMGVKLDKELARVMTIFGVRIVDDLPHYVQCHSAILGKFVKIPTAEEIMAILFQSFEQQTHAENFIRQIMDNTSPQEKRGFVKLISQLKSSHLSRPYVAFLRKMPIFPTTKPTKTSPSYVSIEKISTAVTLSELPCTPTDTLLDVTNHRVRKAALLLGVTPMRATDALRKYVFADIRNQKLDMCSVAKVMDFIYDNFAHLAKEVSFLDELSDVPFVSVGGKRLKKPSDLYDPEDETLKVMFKDEREAFPAEAHTKTQMVHLRELGLKTSMTLPGKDILRVMRKIELEHKSLDKSKCCLKLINQRPELLTEHIEGAAFSQMAMDISWVPVMRKKPDIFPPMLRWCADINIKKPREVVLANVAPLVGSVKSVIQGKICDEVQEAFGWNKSPSLNDVVKQLKCIVESYHSGEKPRYLTFTCRLYRHFIQTDYKDLQAAMKRQQMKTWIWNGDGFVSEDCIVEEGLPVDVSPFVFSLPSEMTEFVHMFTACGMKKRCDLKMLADVLVKIASVSGANNTEQDRKLQMTIDILNYISKQPTGDQLKDQLLVPVHSLEGFKMMPISSASYCDVDWIRQGYDLALDQDDLTFIHPNLPVSTAEKLGVPPLMSRMLNAEELSITGFGQGEPLTSRLHQLLEDYSDGLALFKEMIQNADDAGATEISFLYDERRNEGCMKYLIDEGMKECQGPALWVHNNSEFTEQDFTNITKLGGATKEQEPEKIGRFGLGFNSVYNITDVPSFISRNHIVIFDPHTSHLGKGIKDKSTPGIKIDMAKNKPLLKRLSDQFQPYQGIFGCDVGSGGCYHGTLFRLPLRTQSQAAKSQISALHYDKHEMIALVNMLVTSAHNLLLFTQNVQKLKLLHLPADGSPQTVKEIFIVEKELLKTLRENAITIHKPVNGNNIAQSQTFLSASTQYIKKSNKSGVEPTQVPQSTILIRTSCHTTDNTLFKSTAVGSKHWLISACAGRKKSRKMSANSKSVTIPVGGVAVSLTKTAEGFIPVHMERSSEKSLAFCFLPLPIPTGLPVHINGTFALETNRRHLSQRTDDDKGDRKTLWNAALLEDAVASAYLQALYDMKQLLPSETEVRLYDVWPTQSDDDFTPLVYTFYKDLSYLTHTAMLYRAGRLMTIDNSIFFKEPEVMPPDIYQLIMDVFLCNNDHHHVLSPPRAIVECFTSAGHHNFLAEKLYDIYRFYREVFLPNISRVDCTKRDQLIIYAIEQQDATLNELLMKTSCIPVTPTGDQLKMIADLVNPKGRAARLYAPEDGYFPHGEVFNDKHVLTNLVKLGMKLNIVSWTDIVERAKSVQKLDHAEMMANRYGTIMEFIDQKLFLWSPTVYPASQGTGLGERENKELLEARVALHTIPFLPFSTKPKHYPVAWIGDTVNPAERFSASDLYSSDNKHLVSATQMIVNESKLSRKARNFLDFDRKSITVDQVKLQLEKIAMGNMGVYKKEDFDSLQKALSQIYNYIQDKLKSKDVLAEQLCNMLHDRRCLLIGSRLFAPKDVAQTFHNDCAPYLNAVPRVILYKFKPLMIQLKVKETFGAKDYVRVLQVLHSESNDQILSDRQLDIAITVTRLLSGTMQSSETSESELIENCGEIYIPSTCGILQPSSALCYNDCPWSTDSRVGNYTHPSISFAVSSGLGVRTKRQDILNRHAKGIPFGQKEPLTNSLKRILNSYPCDHQILKELIQNADDAQAKEIHFISDSTPHPDAHIFDDSWKPLQGPALCVYNNKPFTAKDIEGIQLLGEGSKRCDPSKTGQYGVGFSSVYHLTDVPSVFTDSPDVGRSLCVFDPNCAYVPGATDAEPGRRYEDSEDLVNTFPDVFSCYLPEQINIANSTMMRFPLRTRAMAEKSQISKDVISMHTLHIMLDKLKSEAFDILLFLNYLEEIKISDVDPITGNLLNTYSVKISLTSEQRQKRAQFAEQMEEYSQAIKCEASSFSELEHKEIVYTMVVTDNAGRKESWCVVQHSGFKKNTNISTRLVEAFQDGNLMLIPRGGVACPLGKVLQSTERPKRVFCFLPLSMEMHLPVHIHGHFALSHENRQNIWNKDKPEDYRTEWNNLLCSTVVADAYASLIQCIRDNLMDVQKPEDDTFIECTKQLLDEKIATYINYFPSCDEAHTEWVPLVHRVYQFMAHHEILILPAVQRARAAEEMHLKPCTEWQIKWLSLVGKRDKQIYFIKSEEPKKLEHSFNVSTSRASMLAAIKAQSTHDRQVLKEVILDCGMKLIELPMLTVQSIINSGIGVEFFSPEGVLSFLRTCALINDLPCRISGTPIQEEERLRVIITYCKKEDNFMGKLDGLPLLLTEDTVLQMFDKGHPVFASHDLDILEERCNLFIRESFLDIFNSIATQSCCVFRTLTVAEVASNLDSIPHLHRVCSGEDQTIPWDGSKLSKEWVKRFWVFLEREIVSSQSRDQPGDEMSTPHIQLMPLSEWCLVPARCNDRCVLVSFRDARSVVYLIPGGVKWNLLRNVLRNMCVPQLDMWAVSDGLTARSIVTTLDTPVGVVNVLHSNFLKHLDEHGTQVTQQEADNILQYCVQHIDEIEKDNINIIKLRDFPIFKTICGELIALTNCSVYTLPSSIPTNGIDVWQNPQGIVFLKRSKEYAKLHKKLNCVRIGVIEVYCKFVFQHLEYFSDSDRMLHLHYIFDRYIKDYASHKHKLSNAETKNLEDAVRNLCFIPDGSGNLHPASRFFDPNHEVFRVMLPDNELAPHPKCQNFTANDWFTFLRKLGMVTEVNKDTAVRFARQIEMDAYTHHMGATLNKSQVLVKHLFNLGEYSRDEIMSAVNQIRFVVQAEVSTNFTSLVPQYSNDGFGTLHLMSFKDSVCQKFEQLVWTQAATLPAWADPLNQHHMIHAEQVQSLNILEIQKEPQVDMVVRHMQTLSQHVNSMTSDQNVCDTRIVKEVFKELYRFLKGHIDGDSHLVDQLSREPMVPVGNGSLFVKPCQTVISFNEADEIKPFLFKFPTDLGEFVEFFTALRATENVSVEQYVGVLTAIREKKGTSKLTPNETIKVLKALRGFLETLDISNIVKLSVSPLYLPTTSGHMIEPGKLAFNDIPYFYDRVQEFESPIMMDPRDCGADPHHAQEVLKQLPPEMRPRMLSCFVKEELVSRCKTNMRKEGISSQLDERIKSEQFLRAVRRLVINNAHNCGRKFNKEYVDDILERLSTIHVYAVGEIVTELTFRGQPIDGSSRKNVCFVEKTRVPNTIIYQWNVYIQKDGAMGHTLLVAVAQMINDILSGLLGDCVLYLLPILVCPEDEIEAELNSLNIRVDRTRQTIRSPFPTLGTEVDDELLLQLRSGDAEYDEGEYVGFRKDIDYPVIHARVQEKVAYESKIVYKLNDGQGIIPVSAESPHIFKYP